MTLLKACFDVKCLIGHRLKQLKYLIFKNQMATKIIIPTFEPTRTILKRKCIIGNEPILMDLNFSKHFILFYNKNTR